MHIHSLHRPLLATLTSVLAALACGGVVWPSAAPAARVTTAAVAADTPRAWLTIPRLGVSAPVYDRGLDAGRRPLVAPGYAATHYRFSAPLGARGNYVLYGHDDIEGALFHALPTLRPGDRLSLAAAGHRYTYQITGSHVVAPDDVAVLAPTPGATITVLTCTPYGVDTRRLVVTGILQPTQTVAPAHGDAIQDSRATRLVSPSLSTSNVGGTRLRHGATQLHDVIHA